jgi:hypothetical protein
MSEELYKALMSAGKKAATGACGDSVSLCSMFAEPGLLLLLG